VRKKKKKKRRRKKNTMKENMMKIKLFYSSRKEDLTRKKGKRSQGQRGCAIIAVRMNTSLPNTHMRGKKKTMTR
jgi:hypothetical protein